MKFKVGDKVKFIKSTIYHTDDVKIGEVYKIIRIDNLSKSYQVENAEVFNEEELVKADYTYEDLKKAPIGTKVTFENGKVFVKDDKETYENIDNSRCECELVNLKDNNTYEDFGKIIKIEEPTYQTVFETKVDILDEAEKRYLKGIIRPYKNIKSIVKYIYPGERIASIMITILDLDNEDWTFTLPPFEVGNMYKNMKDNKIYTIEELGL